MLIKKFQGASEQEALQMAKEELGSDVIITHIKSIKPKGIYRLFKKPLVEITAAIDEDKQYEKKNFQQLAEEIKKTNYSFRTQPEEGHSYAIEQKLDSLQSMLEKQLQEKPFVPEKEKEEPVQEEQSAALVCLQMIYNQLLANEVEEV